MKYLEVQAPLSSIQVQSMPTSVTVISDKLFTLYSKITSKMRK